jgi:micrococcal nuclease
VALIVAALFAVFVAIGVAVPAPEDTGDEAPQAANETQETPQPTATEEIGDQESTTEEAPPPPPAPLLVASIIDGDTLKLDNGQRVRLVQIDSPEAKGECYGAKATAALRQLLPAGTEVKIVRDRKLDNKDRYGRLLRYVFAGEQNVNLVLLRRGAASVWFFEGDRGRYTTRFTRAADQARAKKRGAWGACQASYDFLAAWTTATKPPKVAQPETSNCDPSYPDVCIPPYDQVGDLDCGDVPQFANFRVLAPDPHGFDGNDNDGYGCESN